MRRCTLCVVRPALFVLLFVVFVQGQGVQQNKADRIPSLSGLVFTDNLLFSQAGASTVACAKLCLKTDTCTTFTHRKATPTTLSACRGHSGYFTAGSPHDNITGTGVYQFRATDAAVIETTTEITAIAETTTQADWLRAECSSDSECTDTAANTRCFVGNCTCIPGYYYSVSSKACIETCSNLDNTYLHYESSCVWSNDHRWMSSLPLPQCLDDCNADDECLSVDFFGTDFGTCYVHHVTVREVPGDWSETVFGVNFYQRNCQ